MNPSDDVYAKGMVDWQQEDDRIVDRYRVWQLDLVRPYLGRRILEIGAGTGQLAQFLMRTHAYDKYVAIEPSPHFFASLREVATNTQNFEVLQATAPELPKSYDGAFDTVFSIHVMEHIEDDAAFLRECIRLTRPGGHVVVLVPALQFLYSPLDEKIGHFRRYEKAMLTNLAAKLGMELVVNRYDNLIGVLGWWWLCKVRGIDYHTIDNKRSFTTHVAMFTKYVLPIVSAVERHVAPPLGLNLTSVLRKPS